MILGSLLSGKKDVFGLDIGTWCVNAVWLRKQRDSYRVMAAGRQKVNVAGGDGQWTEAGLVQAIQKCVKSIHIRSKYAICGLCGPDVALRRFEFPLLDESEVANAVLFEAEQVCPFEEGQFIVDYEVINNGFWGPKTGDEQGRDDTTRGILVAVMADMIGSVNQLVRRASLKCVVMDVNGLALLNCFLESENHEDDETIAILSIGDRFTNVAILPKGGLPFVRDIPHASDEVVEKIAAGYNLPYRELQETFYGWDDNDRHSKAIREGLERACMPLLEGISETLRYYALHESSTVNKVYLCGNFACDQGLGELLQARLPAEVVLWNPLSRMPCASGLSGSGIIEQQGHSLALAAGLAMRSI